MVSFSVFNELSLPFNKHQAITNFGEFFGLLKELKKSGLNQIRMSNDFKLYPILENTSFQQFIGQQTNRDFRTRLKSFISNAIVRIDTPIIKDDDLEQGEQQNSCEYFYKQQSTNGGLACCDIWDTLAVSFNADEQWNKPDITIQKTQIINDAIVENEISIKHASLSEHLDEHKLFFKDIESENSSCTNPLVFCKNKSWLNLNFDQLEKKFGFNLLNSTQTKEFINSFKAFALMSWGDIEQSIGLEYKPYTGDWFNNSVHKGEAIKKFRVSEKYRCFGYRDINTFYVLRFEIDHKISDKG